MTKEDDILYEIDTIKKELKDIEAKQRKKRRAGNQVPMQAAQ